MTCTSPSSRRGWARRARWEPLPVSSHACPAGEGAVLSRSRRLEPSRLAAAERQVRGGAEHRQRNYGERDRGGRRWRCNTPIGSFVVHRVLGARPALFGHDVGVAVSGRGIGRAVREFLRGRRAGLFRRMRMCRRIPNLCRVIRGGGTSCGGLAMLAAAHADTVRAGAVRRPVVSDSCAGEPVKYTDAWLRHCGGAHRPTIETRGPDFYLQMVKMAHQSDSLGPAGDELRVLASRARTSVAGKRAAVVAGACSTDSWLPRRAASQASRVVFRRREAPDATWQTEHVFALAQDRIPVRRTSVLPWEGTTCLVACVSR